MGAMSDVVCTGFSHVPVDEVRACEATEFVPITKS